MRHWSSQRSVAPWRPRLRWPLARLWCRDRCVPSAGNNKPCYTWEQPGSSHLWCSCGLSVGESLLIWSLSGLDQLALGWGRPGLTLKGLGKASAAGLKMIESELYWHRLGCWSNLSAFSGDCLSYHLSWLSLSYKVRFSSSTPEQPHHLHPPLRNVWFLNLTDLNPPDFH